MSWEEYKQEKTCPCGMGRYTITRQENDWGKSHEWFEMNCIRCQDNYVQFTLNYHDLSAPSGVSSSCLWVLRGDKEAVDDIERQIELQKQSMLATAQTRYLKQWLSHFAGKPKKYIWEELKSIDRVHVPSLGTFYKHTGSDSVERYLRHWFEPGKLMAILAFLAITDLDIAEADKRLMDYAQQYQAAKREMISTGVHA